MTYTYTQDAMAPETETTFVPSYARRPAARQKKVKTWMVLAPIAGVLLIGGAATMLINSGGEAPQPLAEPVAAPAVVAQPAPLSSTPAPVVAAAPVVRQAEPVRAPVRRAEPAPARRTAASVAPVVQAPAEPSGPRAYEASATVAASTAVAPVQAPPAPSITVAPLN